MARSESKNYVKLTKVAAALAILRNKPKDVAGEKHTRYLQILCQNAEAGWKEKAVKLQEEVLNLKQQLVKRDIEKGRHEVIQGANIDDEEGVETQDLVYPTPPCSSEDGRSNQEIENVISRHSNFLLSVTRLKNITHIKDSVELHLDTTIKESISCCMRHIRTFLTGGESFPVPLKDVLHVVKIMRTICDMSNPKEIAGTVTEEALMFAGDLLEKIIFQDSLYNQDCYHKDNTSQIIIILGESETIRTSLLQLLVKRLHEYSEKLRDAKFLGESIDPAEFENMFFVFKITEELLKKLLIDLKKSEKEDCHLSDEVIKLEDLFDDSLLHIVDDFPMFAICVWKLKGLLRQIFDYERSQIR